MNPGGGRSTLIHGGGQPTNRHGWEQLLQEAEYLIEKLLPPKGLVVASLAGSATVLGPASARGITDDPFLAASGS